MNRLAKLADEGQSIWLDNIDRAMLHNGDLEKRIAEDSLTGMTSNPTIFEKALAEGSEYDEQLAGAPQGLTPDQLFELVETTDVQRACDLFAGVYSINSRRRRLRVDRVFTRRCQRCEGNCRRSPSPLGNSRSSERDGESSGHRRRRSCSSRAHRCRNQRQHHAALFNRRTRAGYRRVHRWSRRSRRRRQSDRSPLFGCELLREPRRHGDRQATRRDGESSESRRSRSSQDAEGTRSNREREARVSSFPPEVLR